MNKNSIESYYLPLSKHEETPEHLGKIINVFKEHYKKISSQKGLDSNKILSILAESLEELGFNVEKGKKDTEKIIEPLLYDKDGSIVKECNIDAYNEQTKTMLEVEKGGGFVRNTFFKHIFLASVLSKVDYLVLALPLVYSNGYSYEYDEACKHLEILDKSRFKLPLKGILIIGY